jgi:hypothetical protein
MRRPLRKALLWFALALAGVALVVFVTQAFDRLGEVGALIIGTLGGLCVPFGVVYGLTSLLSALGEARLRRGAGVIARWQVAPAEWEAFREFDARWARENDAHANDYTPRPAEGRAVEVLFGRNQVIVDGSYHPLRRWALPELRGIGWLLPPDAPECIEFDLAYPRGRYGGTIPMALRIPVPRPAREDGVRVFHHFKAKVPAVGGGLAFRRPWLVIGWGIGWLMRSSGNESLTAMLLHIVGFISAGGAAFFTAIIVLAVRPWRRNGPG